MNIHFLHTESQSDEKNTLECLTGKIESIDYDLTGPFIHFSQGRAFSQISVDAYVIGAEHDMTLRFHICLRLNQVRDPAARLTLRPAELEDELDDGEWPVERTMPMYHIEYKERLAANTYLTALILRKDASVIDRLRNVLSRKP